MTWEEKLYEILNITSEFKTDSDIGNLTKLISLNCISNRIEKNIIEGNLNYLQDDLFLMKKSISFHKKLLSHLKKNPSCVQMNPISYRFQWQNGKFGLGYDFAPQGIEGIINNWLYYNRLLRDAEVRCLKHPRYKKI